MDRVSSALRYDPGEIRVRLSIVKDYIRISRARWMDAIFKLALLVVTVQLMPSVYRLARAAGLSLKGLHLAVSELKLVDAVWLLFYELGWIGPTAVIVLSTFLLRRHRSVYLLDFALFQPPAEWCNSREEIVQILANAGHSTFTSEDVDFMKRLLDKSGTGEATAFPPGIIRCREVGHEQDQSMAAARREAEVVICDCLGQLFAKTGVRPKEVDFLVINCSLFSPTPSLCAMASNKFKMRSDVRTYNLSGQGCSASLLAVDLCSELLQNNPDSIGVVISTEVITRSLYHGHEKSMLLQNTLFRSGGAAILLTNRSRLVWRAKYRLRHLVRTQCTDDESYAAVFECQDARGNEGVRLSKEIVRVAGDAMKRNLTQMGPLILPLSEQFKVVYEIVVSRLSKEKRARYVPNFKTACDFFCIHAGGRAVLDGIEKNLRLTADDLAPSRTVLFEKGNTSSSSIWYELDYIERHLPMKRGHQILQLAFGSGFKCNSAVWTRLQTPRS